MLDFSKIERGIEDYQFSKIKLNNLVKGVLKVMNYQFKMEKCKVNVHLTKKDYTLHADAVAQALINLLTNAIKYSIQKKVVTLTTFFREGSVAIQVEDTGIGISKDELKHIFEPFYRAKDPKSRQVGGAGLGLSLVRHIMEAHSGKIEVQSTPGKGSTFTLLFPIRN